MANDYDDRLSKSYDQNDQNNRNPDYLTHMIHMNFVKSYESYKTYENKVGFSLLRTNQSELSPDSISDFLSKLLSMIIISTMDAFLESLPDSFRDIYREHWLTIRPGVKKGRLKDVYHFPISPADKIPGKLDEVLVNYQKSVKINVAFGYTMICKRTGAIKFSHPSNNALVFDTSQLVTLTRPSDASRIKDAIEREDLLEIARNSRVSKMWQIDEIVCIRFDVVRLSF